MGSACIQNSFGRKKLKIVEAKEAEKHEIYLEGS
jgi:hypothetical protein